jgi:hypothetical protein
MKLANIVFSAIALMLFSEMPLAQNKNRSKQAPRTQNPNGFRELLHGMV